MKFLIKKFQILLFSCFFVFVFSPVYAASIFFELPQTQVRLGDQFEVGVFIDTQQEDINAIGGELAYARDILELKEIRDGNSVINFWIQRPQINALEFSGIIPGGYASRRGLLFVAVFQTRKTDRANVSIQNAEVLKHDGQGSAAHVVMIPAVLNIAPRTPEQPRAVIVPPIKDNDLPEFFTPVITKIPEIFDNQYVLIFMTQDKGSGIDYYEAREGKGEFQKVASPYLLKNQQLNQDVVVRAVDKSGNIREVVAVKPAISAELDYDWNQYLLWFILIIVLLLIAIILFLLKKWRRVTKQQKNTKT